MFSRVGRPLQSKAVSHRVARLLVGSRIGRHQFRIIASYNDVAGRNEESIIPGERKHQYGSLEDPSFSTGGTPAEPWQASHNVDVQRVTQKALIYEVTQTQQQSTEKVIPWFLDNMPPSYFRQVPDHFRISHIKAIAAIKDADMDLYLNLKSHLPDGREIFTMIRPGTEAGTLLRMVEQLPSIDSDSESYKPLSRLHVFSTKDETMSLNMFVFGTAANHVLSERNGDVVEIGSSILDYAQRLQEGDIPDNTFKQVPSSIFERESLIEFMRQCDHSYLARMSSDPRRFLRQREMFEEVSGTDGTAIRVEEAGLSKDEDPADAGHYWIDIAVANSLPQVALEQMCRLLHIHNFDVTRARLDVIPDCDDGSVTLLRMLVLPHEEEDRDQTVGQRFSLLAREMKRSKWLDESTMKLVFDSYPWLGIRRGEVITAFCSLMHPVMAKENPIAFSKGNILATVTHENYIETSSAIADLFLDRFDPHRKSPMSNEEFHARCDEIRSLIASDDTGIGDTGASKLLNKMVDIVNYTLKTNIYMHDRYALGLRLDPKVMVSNRINDDAEHELPYGVLFAHGRRFNAFHVRFRDISRGGMRLVTPPSPELYELESARQYDECYGLAFAQQLKNKDIPEGGSKAVNLINTHGLSENGRNFVMRKSVKAFTDTILDLIVDTEETRKNIVSLLGKKEVLYLGPDEQVIPEDINWIIRRAETRGYDTPAAFMSSKPRSGINHKEYGVTSEGVNVYLDVALRHVLGIDPTKDSFTIKMTGGPDGDVGGNEIKILIREYGDNVKIVGIADGTGCCEDPKNGLDHDELLRLVNNGLSISHFDKSKLSDDDNAVLHLCDSPEGAKARNTMHNRLEADAFIPCGGRPQTINISNYKQFLLDSENNKPSSPLIVEGANLFVTDDARQALYDEAGVIIVKDSSANKGGVITSSYEICAAMLLSEDEFYQNKDQIVSEVLEKLKNLARMEAELIFKTYKSYSYGSLPTVSQIISRCINIATDALTDALDTLPDDEIKGTLMPLFRSHLPKTMADACNFDETVYDKVPDQYIKNAIASCLASKMVYKEGTKFIEAQPKDKLAEIALQYVMKEKEIMQLVESLSVEGQNGIPEEDKKKIIKLLEDGGVRTSLQVY